MRANPLVRLLEECVSPLRRQSTTPPLGPSSAVVRKDSADRLARRVLRAISDQLVKHVPVSALTKRPEQHDAMMA
jgi:hypothetical protein